MYGFTEGKEAFDAEAEVAMGGAHISAPLLPTQALLIRVLLQQTMTEVLGSLPTKPDVIPGSWM